MATFTINEASVGANVQAHSASVKPPARLSSAEIILVSSQWDAKGGTGDLTWGVERSDDGGATWDRWFYQTLPIGTRSKNGGMPSMRFTGDAITADADTRLRLFGQPTVSIRLGAVVNAS